MPIVKQFVVQDESKDISANINNIFVDNNTNISDKINSLLNIVNNKIETINGKSGDIILNKNDIGLGNVDNLPLIKVDSEQIITSDQKSNIRSNLGIVNLTLGETSNNAYRGDRGKIAYDHASDEGIIENESQNLYKISTSDQGHIISAEPVTKDDLDSILRDINPAAT